MLFELLPLSRILSSSARRRRCRPVLPISPFIIIPHQVHHVLKDHPYRKLAAALKRSGAAPRVLGLSASLTYAVGAKKVEAAVQRLCDELQITSLATADRAELLASGYHASSVPAEVIPVTVPPSELPSGLVPEADRRPHLLAATFFARVRSATATPFALRLIAAIRGMEAAVVAELPAGTFTSPLDGGRPSLKEWGAYAHTLAARHRSRRFAELEHWYEALRLLVVSWEAAEDAATEFLRMMTGGGNGDGAPGCCWRSSTAAPARAAFWAAAPASFPRFSHLKDILHYTLDSAEYLEREFRGILFVEQRAMTHVLAHVVAGDPELAARLSPACLYACSSPATPSLAVTRRAQSFKVLADFASGRTNLLICTVVAEEGMDVPAATNCVIRFDPMPAAQRVLRAGPRPCPPG